MAGEETAIGSNKRYADHYDRLMGERILEQAVVSAGPLQSLTPEELRLDSEPVTIDPRPKPVRAWVRFGLKPALVDAVAVRWTADAVGVVFSIRGTEYRAWVWASAVTPVRRPS